MVHSNVVTLSSEVLSSTIACIKLTERNGTACEEGGSAHKCQQETTSKVLLLMPQSVVLTNLPFKKFLEVSLCF